MILKPHTADPRFKYPEGRETGAWEKLWRNQKVVDGAGPDGIGPALGTPDGANHIQMT